MKDMPCAYSEILLTLVTSELQHVCDLCFTGYCSRQQAVLTYHYINTNNRFDLSHKGERERAVDLDVRLNK